MDSFRNPLDDQSYRRVRVSWLLAGFVAAFLVLSGRLLQVQIFQGDYHARLSDQNSLRLLVDKAPRGRIFDRNGKTVAHNRPSFQIAILPTELKDRDLLLRRLLQFQDTTGARLFDSGLVAWTIERAKWKKFDPLVILEDATYEEMALIEEHQSDLPGVVTVVESRRAYPFGTAAGHVLGYMDEVKEEELREFRSSSGDTSLYDLGDRIGRKGLERRYEVEFRGRDGFRYVKVNAFGKVLEEVEEMPKSQPVPGFDLATSLDMGLQAVAESLLADTVRGAVVALDPRNGEVLVMASSPRMDPNIFSLGKERRSKEWAKLALDPAMPLNNRAVVGGYEPASTFKGIVSIAALASGKIGPKDRMPKACVHGYKFGIRTWKCWTTRGHGSMDMIDAFRESCDVYYYQAGLMLGMDPINHWAGEFGLAQETGIDLESERKGLLMDSATYERMYKKRGWRWTRGLILNLSIGQGQIVTPLQLANYAAGMAHGRTLYRPHLGMSIQRPDGKVVRRIEPEVLHTLDLTHEQHQVILESMRQVMEEPGGTGGQARVPGVVVGGKTGSAENPHGELTHALFICAAPLYAPEIAIAVVLENVGHGGSQAAPVAGALLKRYFHGSASGT